MTIATALQKERILQSPTFAHRLNQISLKTNLEFLKNAISKTEEADEGETSYLPTFNSHHHHHHHHRDEDDHTHCGCVKCANCDESVEMNCLVNLKVNKNINKNKIVINLGSDPVTEKETIRRFIDDKSDCETDLSDQNDGKTSKCNLFSIEQLIKKSS